MSNTRILIVEDEMIIAWSLKNTLEQMGAEVMSIACSAAEAVKGARDGGPDLIMMDVILTGEKTGIDAALEIREFSEVPIVYLTGNTHLLGESIISITRAQGVYPKPLADKQLQDMLELARNKAAAL